jgi:hypothetical protein
VEAIDGVESDLGYGRGIFASILSRSTSAVTATPGPCKRTCHNVTWCPMRVWQTSFLVCGE